MSNYRQFSPYRHHYRPRNRFYRFLVWAGVCIVVILLIKNVFSGSGGDKNNKNGSEVTLAGNTNGSVTTPSPQQLSGTELSTQDCPKAISRAIVDGHYVALTVDGGGIVGDAARVVEALKGKQVPASFFVTGKWTEDNKDLVTAIHDAGFDVFNHSTSHASFKGLTAAKIDSELETADTSISTVTGLTTKPYFRPPFGDYNAASLAEARSQGFCMILWTIDAQDWKTGATADTAKARVLDSLKDGAIIVVQANSDVAADLVGPMIDEVKGRGYTFVTLRDLLRGTEASNITSETVESTNPYTNSNTNSTKNTNTSTNTNKKTNTNSSRTNTNTSNTNTNS